MKILRSDPIKIQEEIKKFSCYHCSRKECPHEYRTAIEISNDYNFNEDHIIWTCWKPKK